MADPLQYQQILNEEVAFHRASVPIQDMPSCTNFFDKWAQCFALGPQIQSFYRYGTGQDCKQKLDDLKFCLTLKSMTKEEKYDAWIQRRAERTASHRLSPQSSENVWQFRRDTSVEEVDPKRAAVDLVV